MYNINKYINSCKIFVLGLGIFFSSCNTKTFSKNMFSGHEKNKNKNIYKKKAFIGLGIAGLSIASYYLIPKLKMYYNENFGSVTRKENINTKANITNAKIKKEQEKEDIKVKKEEEKEDINQESTDNKYSTLLPKNIKGISKVFNTSVFSYKDLFVDALTSDGLLYNLRNIYNIDKSLRDLLNFIFKTGPIGNLLVYSGKKEKDNLKTDLIKDPSFAQILSYATAFMDIANDIAKVDFKKVVLFGKFLQEKENKNYDDIKKIIIKNKDLFKKIKKNKNLKTTKDLTPAMKHELESLDKIKINIKKPNSSQALAFKILSYVEKIINKGNTDDQKPNNEKLIDKSKLALMTLLLKLPNTIKDIKIGLKSVIDNNSKNIISGHGFPEKDWLFSDFDIEKIEKKFEYGKINDLTVEEILIYYNTEIKNEYRDLNVEYTGDALYNNSTFPDCVESTILSLVNFAIYDFKEGKFNKDKIRKDTELGKKARNFYEKYKNKEEIQINICEVHNDWAEVISNHKKIFEYRDGKPADHNIKANYKNIKNGLKQILNFDNIKIDGDDEKNDNETLFYKKFARIINADFDVEEINGIFNFINEDGRTLFSLQVIHDAHAEINFTDKNLKNYEDKLNNTESVVFAKYYINEQKIGYNKLKRLNIKKIYNILLCKSLSNFKKLLNAKSILDYIQYKRKKELEKQPVIYNKIKNFSKKVNEEICKKFIREFINPNPNINPEVVSYLYLNDIINYIKNEEFKLPKQYTSKEELINKIKKKTKEILKKLDIGGYRLNLKNPGKEIIDLGKSQFIDIDFNYSKFENINFQNSRFHKCIFKNISFGKNVSMSKTKFNNCNFKNWNINNLKNAKFNNCKFETLPKNIENVEFIDIEYLPLQNCNLKNVTIDGYKDFEKLLSLENIKYKDLQLSNCTVKLRTLRKLIKNKVKLQNIYFEEEDNSDNLFKDSKNKNLKGIIFRKSNNIPDSDLGELNLEGLTFEGFLPDDKIFNNRKSLKNITLMYLNNDIFYNKTIDFKDATIICECFFTSRGKTINFKNAILKNQLLKFYYLKSSILNNIKFISCHIMFNLNKTNSLEDISFEKCNLEFLSELKIKNLSIQNCFMVELHLNKLDTKNIKFNDVCVWKLQGDRTKLPKGIKLLDPNKYENVSQALEIMGNKI